MRYVSDAFAKRLQDNSTLTAKATIAYADGTEQSLTGDDFCSVEVEQATSSSGSFDIGAAVVGQLTCTLNNYDDRFSEKDFEGAVLTMWVGTTLASGDEEWVKLGVFTVDRPDSYAGQINITALDNLSLMEGEFVSSKITWPASLQTIADVACTACGLINDTASIPNGSYIVKTAPDSDDLTWLDVVGYVAQATGTFCRSTADGHIEFAWYDTTAHEKESDLDGGSFDSSSPYSTGDTADGGDFTDYSSGATFDGGTFADMRRIGQVNRYTSMTIFTDDVVITGVSVTAQNQVVQNSDGSESNGEDGETAVYGSDGYVLSLEDNPLVLYGQAATVAAHIGERVVGMRFRPFSCDAVLDPSIEAGDAILVWDRKGNCYESYVTSTRISVNGSETIECAAESASRNSADKASAATKAVVKARNDLKREQTARELAQKDLQQKMENAAGLYSTSVEQPDGSYVYYLHDKSDLASSKIVWKMTADAMAVSTAGPDGPYVSGLTADGTALLKRIYAIGIDADHITAGKISSKDGKAFFNLDTGEARFALSSDTTVNGIVNIGKTVLAIYREYCYSDSNTIPPEETDPGWSEEQYSWQFGVYVWSRDVTAYTNGGHSFSNYTCISDGTNWLAVTEYSVSENPDEPGEVWDSTPPEVPYGLYLWMRTVVCGNGATSEDKVLGVVRLDAVNNMTALIYSTVLSCDVEYTMVLGSNKPDSFAEWSSTFSPADWFVGYSVWTRTKTKSAAGFTTYTDPIMLTGPNGTGLEDIVEQYYLSTSDTKLEGGSWEYTQPAWETGHFYWTRSELRFTGGGTGHSTPVLAMALTAGNQSTDNLDNALNATGVFNRLTNNGTMQGLFTYDGNYYFNASYITAGILDAALVRIKNLMKIGSDAVNVQVASDNISFWADGKRRMAIAPSSHHMKSFSFMGDATYLFGYAAGKTTKKYISLDVTWSSLFAYVNNKYVGEFAIDFIYTTLPNGTKTTYGKQTYSYSEGTIPSSITFSGTKQVAISLVNRNGTAAILLQPNTVGNPTGGYVWGIQLDCSVAGTVSDIRAGDDIVLTTSNALSAMRSCGLSCAISLPFQFNNSMYNVRLTFTGGILTDVDTITPTSELFSATPWIFKYFNK